MKKQYKTLATIAVISMVTSGMVFAESPTNTNQGNNTGKSWSNHQGGSQREGFGFFGKKGTVGNNVVNGTVTAVNGNTITVSGKIGMGTTTQNTVFIIDATNAKVLKDNVTGTISSILTGDKLFVQGTITGGNVVATTIRDGQGLMLGRGDKDQKGNGNTQITQGNGQPIIAGNVTVINGNNITITNKSNVTYTVDVTNAVVTINGNTSTTSLITVGDMVVVQGQINGNNVIASTINDNKVSTTNNSGNSVKRGFGGFFGGILHFFGF